MDAPIVSEPTALLGAVQAAAEKFLMGKPNNVHIRSGNYYRPLDQRGRQINTQAFQIEV